MINMYCKLENKIVNNLWLKLTLLIKQQSLIQDYKSSFKKTLKQGFLKLGEIVERVYENLKKARTLPLW